ncbi:hypothetical protein OG689_10795 [Kitasatospora sp. NBC_00240]|uniref:hypothetical protein n=1 Tax=Kitasatospora sp. NBC_00240 TaxID=2903567 RepID=UPI00224DBE81|nr:hypothetical protein [Kitasatospora sp. NBC_00240]MCX5209771.1 hypothetical protein [Kitasatospora sp. NBC_00240]
MTDPIDLAAEVRADAKVQAALRKLANAAVELHLSLAALGADHPHIGSDAMALVPGLMGEAIQDGLSRVTVAGWATTVRVSVHRDGTKEG